MFDSIGLAAAHPVTDMDSTQIAGTRMQAVSSLLRNSSIELSTNGEPAIRKASEILPPGMPVYVPKIPRQTLHDKLVQLRLLHKYGLDPIPHIVARQLSSRQELSDFLRQAIAEAGVHRVLIIGGDADVALGPYADSGSVLASGVLQEVGIRVVDVAGYPDGHPTIPAHALATDLRKKARFAEDHGFDLNVVTQFSFEPENIVAFCADLATEIPGVPVYAGLAGPTSPAKLLRFARTCGVGTSLRAANKLGLGALKLAAHSNPDKQFEILAENKAAAATGNLAGIHLFSFGGFADSSRWLDDKARLAGVRS